MLALLALPLEAIARRISDCPAAAGRDDAIGPPARRPHRIINIPIMTLIQHEIEDPVWPARARARSWNVQVPEKSPGVDLGVVASRSCVIDDEIIFATINDNDNILFF